MKTGRILHRFTAKDGKEVILRTPRWEDLDDLMEYINSLVDEDANINRTRKVTREEEADWLGRKLALLEKRGRIYFSCRSGWKSGGRLRN